MRVLTLDSALARVSAAIFEGGKPISVRLREVDRGQGALLAEFAAEVMRDADLGVAALEAVAVTVGPGSFTGIRGALSLAHGIGLAAAVPVIGVTVGEALAAAGGGHLGDETWAAIDNHRGRIFLETGAGVVATDLAGLPLPTKPVVVLGDAAELVARFLQARGADIVAGDACRPDPQGMINAALDRMAGDLPPRRPQPLYVDPAAVRLPQAGLRPPPCR